jgi:NAD-dependent dihydropyrimidine dehydrogenase PreA subunit
MNIQYRGGIRINHAKCIGCKRCYEMCPPDVFEFDDHSKLLRVAYPEECWFCGTCIFECPVEGALTMELPLACL